jgi:cell wall-active antibiotic response 4TMS protein YvqF/uncharacterized protein DUF1707
MATDDLPGKGTVNAAQERAIAQLSDAFAHDRLGVEEFEQRLTLVHRAASITDIARTVSDLVEVGPDGTETEWRPAARAIVVASESALATDSVAAIFGGIERRGPWRVPSRLDVVATMGGIELDFRDAVLGPGVTEIHVRAVFGGVQIIVPPNLPVEVSGTAIFGGFGHVERMPAQVDPGRPMLRVRGIAVFGGVSVETRLPGESEADAHRHRHHALSHGREPRRLPGPQSTK